MADPTGSNPEFGLERPVVAASRPGVSWWWFAILGLLSALLLFHALNARRNARSSPAIMATLAERDAAPADLPALYIPPELKVATSARPAPTVTEVPYRPARRMIEPSPTTILPYSAPSNIPLGSPLEPGIIYSPAPTPSIGPLMAVGGQAGVALPQQSSPSQGSGGSPSTSGPAVGRIGDPSRTLAQGTLISAVLETAFDSSRPGQARAIVSRDVRSFDGNVVLIPRGSKLYGEYKADATAGQRRALIQWMRLLLPDGGTVSLDSPVADALGRAGVSGSVNTHFIERFAGTILQSSFDLGIGLASRRFYNSGPVVVALPGTTNTVSPTLAPREIPPTIKVRPGTRISVFAARDLEFSEMVGP